MCATGWFIGLMFGNPKKIKKEPLLVEPDSGVVVPVTDVLAKPHFNLCLGRFDSVATVANISPNIKTEVAADGPWCTIKRFRLAEHFSAENSD